MAKFTTTKLLKQEKQFLPSNVWVSSRGQSIMRDRQYRPLGFVTGRRKGTSLLMKGCGHQRSSAEWLLTNISVHVMWNIV